MTAARVDYKHNTEDISENFENFVIRVENSHEDHENTNSDGRDEENDINDDKKAFLGNTHFIYNYQLRTSCLSPKSN